MNVGLHAFLCEGNLGDQAMAEGLAGRLLAAGHAVTVFAHGRDPHDAARLAALGCTPRALKDRSAARGLDALVIGGGSLGPGFGWDLAVQVKLGGGKLLAFGQGYGSAWADPAVAGASKSMLALHDLVVARDAGSVGVLASLGVAAVRGGDPALLLPAPGRPKKPGRPLLFVRHPEPGGAGDHAALAREAASALGGRPDVGHCSDADADFWAGLGIGAARAWRLRDPHDALRRAAAAPVVLTVGRYHPMVFAGHAGTPCVAVPCRPGDRIDAGLADAGAVRGAAGGLAAAVRLAHRHHAPRPGRDHAEAGWRALAAALA